MCEGVRRHPRCGVALTVALTLAGAYLFYYGSVEDVDQTDSILADVLSECKGNACMAEGGACGAWATETAAWRGSQSTPDAFCGVLCNCSYLLQLRCFQLCASWWADLGRPVRTERDVARVVPAVGLVVMLGTPIAAITVYWCQTRINPSCCAD